MGAVAYLSHCLGSVDQQIEDHLLQLHSVTNHLGRRRRELQPQRYCLLQQFALQHEEGFADRFVDVESRPLWLHMRGKGPNPINHFGCAMGVFDYALDGTTCLAKLRNFVV